MLYFTIFILNTIGNISISNRIYLGDIAVPGQSPWSVALFSQRKSDNMFSYVHIHCSGTYVKHNNQHLVVTASHCLPPHLNRNNGWTNEVNFGSHKICGIFGGIPITFNKPSFLNDYCEFYNIYGIQTYNWNYACFDHAIYAPNNVDLAYLSFDELNGNGCTDYPVIPLNLPSKYLFQTDWFDQTPIYCGYGAHNRLDTDPIVFNDPPSRGILKCIDLPIGHMTLGVRMFYSGWSPVLIKFMKSISTGGTRSGDSGGGLIINNTLVGVLSAGGQNVHSDIDLNVFVDIHEYANIFTNSFNKIQNIHAIHIRVDNKEYLLEQQSENLFVSNLVKLSKHGNCWILKENMISEYTYCMEYLADGTIYSKIPPITGMPWSGGSSVFVKEAQDFTCSNGQFWDQCAKCSKDSVCGEEFRNCEDVCIRRCTCGSDFHYMNNKCISHMQCLHNGQHNEIRDDRVLSYTVNMYSQTINSVIFITNSDLSTCNNLRATIFNDYEYNDIVLICPYGYEENDYVQHINLIIQSVIERSNVLNCPVHLYNLGFNMNSIDTIIHSNNITNLFSISSSFTKFYPIYCSIYFNSSNTYTDEQYLKHVNHNSNIISSKFYQHSNHNMEIFVHIDDKLLGNKIKSCLKQQIQSYELCYKFTSSIYEIYKENKMIAYSIHAPLFFECR